MITRTGESLSSVLHHASH